MIRIHEGWPIVKITLTSKSPKARRHTVAVLSSAALVVGVAGVGGAYGLSHLHGGDEVGVGDHPVQLACGSAFASGPAPVYMDKTRNSQVPRHGRFTLVVTRNCKAATHVVSATGVKVFGRFQGLDFAYDVSLQRKRATIAIDVNGVKRTLALVGANPPPP